VSKSNAITAAFIILRTY